LVDPLAQGIDPGVAQQLDSGMSFLAELEAGGQDAFSLILDPSFEADAQADQATRAGAPIPGETDSLRISLTEDQANLFALELCDLLDEYDRAMALRNDREGEICDAYAMIGDDTHGGRGPQSAQMTSEMTMSFVDQAYARIGTGIMGITPLIRVDPIEAAGFEGEEAAEAARSAEQFLQSYCLEGPPDLRYKLPVALLRATKVGTAVLYVEWADEVKRRRYYPPDPGLGAGPVEPITTEEREGKILVHLIENRNVKIWPPNVTNWQDAIFIGHEAQHTPQSWRTIARRYQLDDDLKQMIANNPSESLDADKESQRRHGVETSSLLDRKDLQPVSLTQLYGKMALPGDDEPLAMQVILHRPTRKLVYVGHNPHFSERKPYFPLRYKWSDDSAWGTGVGHECIEAQAADTAMWCLELDNLMAGAYWVILRRPGSMYNTQNDDLRPGAQIVCDDVNEDFKSVKVGGEAPELTVSRLNNYTRARTGTGLSSVASGMGDPVMKSGAGTGSVLALIDQGDKKLRMIDSNVRTDLTPLFSCFLDFVAQYAPDGIFYRYVSERDAANLRLLKFTPPRGGELSQMFRLRAQAPSIGASDESRKDRVMLVGNLAQQHIQVIDAMVTEELTQSNPAALPRWKEMVIQYLTEIHLQTVRLNELPRLPEMVPQMPPPIPIDEQMNALTEENASLQQQLAQVQQQLQQLAQAGMGMVDQGGMEGGAVGEAMPIDPSQMPIDPSVMGGMMPEGGPGGMVA